jgi:hypothetical protein
MLFSCLYLNSMINDLNYVAINDKQISFLIVGMALSSTFFTVILWLLGHSIQCLAMTIPLTVTHLMSSFVVNYQLS